MGAKTSILMFAERDPREVLREGQRADEQTARELAEEVFPGRVADAIGTLDLDRAIYPPDDTVYAGRFAGVDIVCCRELMDIESGDLNELVVRVGGRRDAVVHLMHSVSDALSFASWADGRVQRSLNLAPDSGIVEDLGPHLDFEFPYWAGDRPVDDEDDEEAYPLPFHPLELGEDALRHFFGFIREGRRDPADVDPSEVHLIGFRITPAKAAADRAF